MTLASTRAAWSRNGKILATGDDNGNVYLWNVDAATETPIATLHGPEGGVEQSIAFSPRGGIVAATSDSTDLKNPNYVTCVWNLSGKRLATFHDPNGAFVTRVAFSPDGSMLAVADENANTYIWDMDGFSS